MFLFLFLELDHFQSNEGTLRHSAAEGRHLLRSVSSLCQSVTFFFLSQCFVLFIYFLYIFEMVLFIKSHVLVFCQIFKH